MTPFYMVQHTQDVTKRTSRSKKNVKESLGSAENSFRSSLWILTVDGKIEEEYI